LMILPLWATPNVQIEETSKVFGSSAPACVAANSPHISVPFAHTG
jgi:hypothetical protein